MYKYKEYYYLILLIPFIISTLIALHDYFEKNKIDGLSDHDHNRCSQCLSSPHKNKERLAQTSSTNELFSKLR